MDNNVETLNLNIGQRKITVRVEKRGVYYYKEAERVINEAMLNFAKKWEYSDHQDLLSKILLEFVVKWLLTKEKLDDYKEHVNPMLEHLSQLADQLETNS